MLAENTNVKNWIALTLTNVNPTSSKTIDLFRLNVNYDGATKYTALNVFYKNGAWTVTTSTGNTNLTSTSPSDLLTQLNALFQENGEGVFYGENAGGGFYNIYAYSDDYTFVSITNPSPTVYNFTSTSSNVVGGSQISVVSESSISMNDITQELLYQPYLLLGVNVYADTIAQANKELQLRDYEMNGTLRKKFKNPAISPMQQQFVLENIELNYIPDATNQLQYTLDAGESVRMIFKYFGGSLMQIKEIQKDGAKYKGMIESGDLMSTSLYDSYDERNNETVMQAVTPKRTYMKYTVTSNPMMLLVVKHNPEIQPELSELLTVHIDQDRDVTVEEVENAFLDTDFKEVG